MSKGLEALECVDYIENKLAGLRYECERIKNHRCDDLFIQEHIFTTIKQALLELKTIKEAKSSEAMESLERIDKEYATIEYKDFKICFNTIKQALIKAQKQEKKIKALEIIKKKESKC